MADTAKIFTNGRSQAVRLPAAYRFDGQEVSIRRDPATGDVILSARPSGWGPVLSEIRQDGGESLFLEARPQGDTPRDPFSRIAS